MKKLFFFSLGLIITLSSLVQLAQAASTTYVTRVSSTLANGNYQAGQVVPIVVTFSQPVIVTSYGSSSQNSNPQLKLQLDNSLTGTAYFSAVSGNQITFNYTAGANDQTAWLDYASTTSLIYNSIDPSQVTITNASSSEPANLILTLPGSASSLVGNAKISFDNHSNPAVLNVSALVADGAYRAGDTIPLTVSFSRPVTVSPYVWRSFNPSRSPKFSPQTRVFPALTLTFDGGVTKAVTYSSGSGSTVLNFDYTISSGETTGKLAYASSSALTFNRDYLNLANPETGVTIYEDSIGSIADTGTVAAVLTLPLPDATGSLSANKNIRLDGQSPVLTLVGESLVVIGGGDTYTDAGATAADNLDGNLTGSIITTNNLNSSRVGAYTYSYNVSDSAGNSAPELTRTIKVKNTLSNLPALSTMETGAAITVAGSDLYQYRLDNQSVSNVITANHPLTLSNLNLGFHSLTVWGRNEADLDWLDTPATYAWVVTDSSGQAANVVSVSSSNSTVSIGPDWGEAVVLLTDASLTNTKIDLSQMLTRGGGTNTVILSGTNLHLHIQTIYGFLEVDLPTGMTITGPSTWDGTIQIGLLANSAMTAPTEAGYTNTVNTVLEVGSVDNSLSFDQAVRMVLPAQAGSKLLWSTNSGSSQALSAVCASDTQSWTNANLATGGECSITAGSDAIIWTKHFSKFASYSHTAVVSAPASGGGSYTVNQTDLKLLADSGLTLDSGTSTGQVLGLKVYNFSRVLRLGMKNDQVSLLQFLLIKQNAGPEAKLLAKVGITGYFGSLTQSALTEYQKYYKLNPANGILNYRTKLHFKNLSQSLRDSLEKLAKK